MATKKYSAAGEQLFREATEHISVYILGRNALNSLWFLPYSYLIQGVFLNSRVFINGKRCFQNWSSSASIDKLFKRMSTTLSHSLIHTFLNRDKAIKRGQIHETNENNTKKN